MSQADFAACKDVAASRPNEGASPFRTVVHQCSGTKHEPSGTPYPAGGAVMDSPSSVLAAFATSLSPSSGRATDRGDLQRPEAAQGTTEQSEFRKYEAAQALRNELSRQQPRQTPPCAATCNGSQDQVRSVLVSWIVEVVALLRLGAATLFITVELLDAFMARQALLPPDKILQLLALTCLSVATRKEESNRQITLYEWASMAADPNTGAPLYEVEDLRRMEWLVLETLEWRTLQPTKYGILQHLLQCLETDPWFSYVCEAPTEPGARSALMACANFLAELSLPCDAMQHFQHSTVATGCIALALQLCRVKACASPGTESTCSVSGASASAAAATPPRSPSPCPAAAAACTALKPPQPLAVAAAFAAAVGVEDDVLAPGLAQCMEVLDPLYDSAVQWFLRCEASSLAGAEEQAVPPAWLSLAVIQRHDRVLSFLVRTALPMERGYK